MGLSNLDKDRGNPVAISREGLKPLPGREVYRRSRKAVPLWRHVLGSILFCISLAVAAVCWVEVFGNASDAIPEQRVDLSLPPQAPAFDSLNGNGSALPDLLEEVAAGTNPTEAIAEQLQLDALGNPIGGTMNEQMAGENTARVSTTTRPREITINGQSIGGGLIQAPVTGLTRQTPYGLIPARAADGRSAFKVYARPFASVSNTKPVSIAIGGLGINKALTQRAINELPPEVTLSFAAHAPNLQKQINEARRRGHEVMIELPMESEGFDPTEPGSDSALRVGSGTAAQNKRNLDRLLSRASGYFAVTNYNGGVFLQRSDSVVPMMAALSNAGVGFVFDGSITAPSLPTLANASKLPFLKAFTLIDANPDSGSIKGELDRMATLAQSGASPVGVGFTYPQTIDAVSEWVAGLESQGLTLAPVSSRVPG